MIYSAKFGWQRLTPRSLSTGNENDILAVMERKGYSVCKATKYGRYPPFSQLSQHLPIYGEIFQVHCSVEPTIGQGVTGFIEEFHSFPHEKVPIYYEIGHHQLKDKELLIYDPLDLTITDSWALERDKSEQANSPI